MIPDRLFDEALKYKKTRLWKKLYDTQLFAVRHWDGEIGYCCVMGMSGTLTALALYPGQAGLDSLRMLWDAEPDDRLLTRMERMRCQDCLMLSLENKAELPARDRDALADYCRRKGIVLRGRNANPHFERFRPGLERWYLEDPDDQRRLLEGIRAACEVARRLDDGPAVAFSGNPGEGTPIPLLIPEGDGFRWESHALPPRAQAQYPAAPETDDLTRTRLAQKRSGSQWAAKAFRYLQPITDESGAETVALEQLNAPPFFPYLLALVDLDQNAIISMNLAQDADEYAETLRQAFVDTALELGLPRMLLVEDDRTAALLAPLCRQLGVRLERRDAIPQLDELMDDFAERTLSGAEEQDADSAFDDILQAIRQPMFLRGLPDELLRHLLGILDTGMIPDDIVDIVLREAERRGLM